MTARWIFFGVALVALSARHGGAHCTPIEMLVVDEQVTLSGGLVAPGLAGRVYGESDPECQPFPGDAVWLSDIPGVDLTGLAPGAGLFYEPLAMPDYSQPGAPQRMLWHWDPLDQQVDDNPEGASLRVLSTRLFGDVTFDQHGLLSESGQVQALEPLASDLGRHVHPFYYVLAGAGEFPSGVYGWFGRFTSPGVAPSEPLLMLMNFDQDAGGLLAAAAAINTAALAPLPGDYNRDGAVDAEDLAKWRADFGLTGVQGADGNGDGVVDAADYTVWRDHWAPAAGQAAAVATPEPTSLLLLVAGMLVAGLVGRGGASTTTR
ncbi:hypothetical protein Pla175_49950 [Pirellulimonas nuda]|uniref:PEP-CTERM protein-sorting domain-containing protein n=1 Tax=Pirellulimonas nuda TaxID=2528009 RepID=A0A518DJE7_9BACT|nr:dockerin type I repeat-containing protein [Pirellulimonas nuda]QDU91566.1 hypothetical protein Pla175_49950 [Pirellulimonas nuda]